MDIILDHFKLEEFSEYNPVHIETINKLNRDYYTSKYLGDLFYVIQRTKMRKEIDKDNYFYIAYYNDLYPIGIISMATENSEHELSIGILPDKRKQNYATMLTEQYAEYIFKNTDIKELVLKIKDDNIGSIRAADMNSFKYIGREKYVRRR